MGGKIRRDNREKILAPPRDRGKKNQGSPLVKRGVCAQEASYDGTQELLARTVYDKRGSSPSGRRIAQYRWDTVYIYCEKYEYTPAVRSKMSSKLFVVFASRVYDTSIARVTGRVSSLRKKVGDTL